MKENKKRNIFSYLFLILFVSYTAIYLMVNLGYYEYANYTKKTFTEEQIKKFEEDVKNGVALDINEYLIREDVVNTKKQLGLKVSEFIGKLARKSIIGIFELLNKIIET